MAYIRGSLLMVFLNLFTMQAALADGSGSKFRNWLLGSVTQVANNDPDDIGPAEANSECLACHDGVRAKNVVAKSAEMPLQWSSAGRQVNHPVGMRYDDYAARRPGHFKPRTSLDPMIQLANGQVTCLSCHQRKEMAFSLNTLHAKSGPTISSLDGNPDCTASPTLTVGPRQTDLCLSCHNM